jgi:hypothetical protein
VSKAAEAQLTPQPAAIEPLEFPDRVKALIAAAAAESLVVVVVAAFAVTLVVRLSAQVNQDAWLAFLNGRSILDHGLPHRDLFTIWGSGPWVDQQWLSQVALYGLYAAGGIALVAFAHALLTAGAVAAAVAAARRRASAQHTLLPLPFVFWVLAGSTWQARTQSFAYPLFVAVLLLLVADSRRPSRRVYLTIPLLALWANLHGSVVLGVGLVCLRALLRLIDARRVSRSPRVLLPGLSLFLLAPAMLFASPYGLSLAGYYHHTLLNPAFAMVNEWQPPAFNPLTAPFFVLAIGTAWLLGRARSALTAYERLALLLTLLAAFTATRNLGWFALTATVLVPAALDEALPKKRVDGRRSGELFNTAFAAVSVVALLFVLTVTLFRPASWFTAAYPKGGAEAVARAAAADPSTTVFADVKYGDWLLFVHPRLAGRVAYDARFELLPTRRISQIYNLSVEDGGSWPAATRGFRLVVLDRANESHAIAGLRRAGARVLYDAKGMVVLERPPA